jgi:drug/metabolite transporter (DMT)-like permease
MSRADFARLVALGALWGLAFVFIRVAVPPLGPVTLTFVRVLIAGVLLALYARHAGAPLEIRKRWVLFLVVGLFNSAGPFSLVASAQTVMSASWAVVLVATTPLQSALVAAVVLRERLTPRKGVGLVLGIAGVAVLVGWREPLAVVPPAWAVLCALGAGLMYSFAAIITKRYGAAVPTPAMAAGTMLGAAVLVGPFVPLFPPVAMPGPEAALSTLLLAAGSTTVAMVIYFGLIRSVGPTKALTVNLLSPLFGVTASILLLGEPMSWPFAAGGALILCGLALALREPLPQAPPRA